MCSFFFDGDRENNFFFRESINIIICFDIFKAIIITF